MVPALPKTIRVAAFDFRLEAWNPRSSATAQRFGEFSPSENVLRVDVTAAPLKVLDTLLHETLHAIYWAYTIADADDEERTVGILSTAWTQVYRDNPWLLRWAADVVAEAEEEGEASCCGWSASTARWTSESRVGREAMK